MGHLFSFQLKKQLRLIIFFSVFIAILSAAATFFFDDQAVLTLNESRAQAPGLFQAFGISGSLSLLDHITSLLYGFIFPVLGSVLAIYLSSRLIPGQIETGELTYYLALPLRRYRLILINAAVVFACLIIVLVVNISGTVLAATFMKPQTFNIVWFLVLNLGLFSLWLMSAGLALMIACTSDERRRSNRLNLFIFFSLYILAMLGQVKSFPNLLAYVSIYSLWNPQDLSKGLFSLITLVMPLIGGLFLMFGLYRFSKRDLPL